MSCSWGPGRSRSRTGRDERRPARRTGHDGPPVSGPSRRSGPGDGTSCRLPAVWTRSRRSAARCARAVAIRIDQAAGPRAGSPHHRGQDAADRDILAGGGLPARERPRSAGSGGRVAGIDPVDDVYVADRRGEPVRQHDRHAGHVLRQGPPAIGRIGERQSSRFRLEDRQRPREAVLLRGRQARLRVGATGRDRGRQRQQAASRPKPAARRRRRLSAA